MDLASNTDLLPVMLYARRSGEWDYSNCLTLLLRHKVRARVAVRAGRLAQCWPRSRGGGTCRQACAHVFASSHGSRLPTPPPSPQPPQGKPVVAAIVRVFGPQLAELPLIATKNTARRQGHARILVDCFQNMLKQVSRVAGWGRAILGAPGLHGRRHGVCSPARPACPTTPCLPPSAPPQAGVHTLVLPAAHETVETWKSGFQFTDMPEDDCRWAGLAPATWAGSTAGPTEVGRRRRG